MTSNRLLCYSIIRTNLAWRKSMDLVWFIVLPVAGLVLGWTIRWLYARFQLSASEQRAERVKQDAIKEAEAQKKEILLEAKDQLIRERNQQERENRERRSELQRYERRLTVKEETLDKRMATLDKQEQDFVVREQQITEKEVNLASQEEKYRQELERISGLTAQEAKNLIIQNLENEARHDAQALLNKIEQEAQLTSERKLETSWFLQFKELPQKPQATLQLQQFHYQAMK